MKNFSDVKREEKISVKLKFFYNLKMNKRYYVIALLVCLVLLVSACKKSGAAAGSAPRTPFIGGTGGITINFEKDNPPPEVTDDDTFRFQAIVRLKNEGETEVKKDNIKVNLAGFDPSDFKVSSFDSLRDQIPEDDLIPKRRDAEGNIQEGNPTSATFPKTGDFSARKFPGNTEFTFRADVCYAYETRANTKMCVLRDMINVRENSFCKPTGSRTVHSSSASVQVANFRQSVVGQNKLTFSFDVVLSGNVDIFRNKDSPQPPVNNFDQGCPRTPRERRETENKVGIEISETPSDPIFETLPKCSGLDNSNKGVVTLISGRRTVTCTVDLRQNRDDLEKTIEIKLDYNVLDSKETKVVVKHLASTTP